MNQTDSVSGVSNSSVFTVSGLSTEKTFDWYCEACDSEDCYFADANRTVTIDLVQPAIGFVNPTPANNTRNSTSNN